MLGCEQVARVTLCRGAALRPNSSWENVTTISGELGLGQSQNWNSGGLGLGQGQGWGRSCGWAMGRSQRVPMGEGSFRVSQSLGA